MFIIKKPEIDGSIAQRQMPKNSAIIREKDYCDLLYAWLQCNSERTELTGHLRRIPKKKIKWTKLEEEFTRTDNEGNKEKLMNRKTIAKYFRHLESAKLVYEEGDYYYLTVLDRENGHLIEYSTLEKLMTTLQKNSLNIYIYLFNRFCANGYNPVIITMAQIKEHIGVATSTTSNNIAITHTIDILKRLGLLEVVVEMDESNMHQYMRFKWVKNKLD